MYELQTIALIFALGAVSGAFAVHYFVMRHLKATRRKQPQYVKEVEEVKEDVPVLTRNGPKFTLVLSDICYVHNHLAGISQHYALIADDVKAQRVVDELKANNCNRLTVSFLGYISHRTARCWSETDTMEAVDRIFDFLLNAGIGLDIEMHLTESGMNVDGSSLRREIYSHIQSRIIRDNLFAELKIVDSQP